MVADGRMPQAKSINSRVVCDLTRHLTAQLEPRYVRLFRDEKVDRPEAANGLVKALRQLFKWACDPTVALLDRNPARDIAYLKSGSEGFHSWTIDEVRQFEERHPVGSRARLMLALLLYTGQRRSDVGRLGRQHIREGRLVFVHAPVRRNPIRLEIPILPELQRIIDASPVGDLAFLVTEFNRPFSQPGFGNKMRRWCDQAGLRHCSSKKCREADH
jgi:integrase